MDGLARARDYAKGLRIRLVVLDGLPWEGSFTARIGSFVTIYIHESTAAGPDCGDMVYRACEASVAAQALVVNVHLPTPRLIAS